MSMSIVEQTLRTQRDVWQEISQKTAGVSSRDLPMEPPKRILLFGVGSSFFAAKLTACSLLRDRTRARVPVVACASQGIGFEVFPQKGDWAFAFSHRGKTPVTLQALQHCERAGAFPILVAGQGVEEPPFAKWVLPTSPLEKVEPHTVSVTGAICGVTTLLLGTKAVEEWDALRSIGDPELENVCRRAGRGPSVIIGDLEGEWIAREGALKFMEMARLPVRAFGSEEFFHGPRFSVKSDDVLWHVSLPNDPRNDDIQAAHRVSVFGSSPLAWLPALVELQWLALAAAVNLGVNPDDVTA